MYILSVPYGHEGLLCGAESGVPDNWFPQVPGWAGLGSGRGKRQCCEVES